MGQQFFQLPLGVPIEVFEAKGVCSEGRFLFLAFAGSADRNSREGNVVQIDALLGHQQVELDIFGICQANRATAKGNSANTQVLYLAHDMRFGFIQDHGNLSDAHLHVIAQRVKCIS